MRATCKTVAPADVSQCLIGRATQLVERVAGCSATVSLKSDPREVTISAPLSFPDGIGSGLVRVTLRPRHDVVDLKLWIDHNRVFVTGHGGVGGSRCFLNDYVAAISLPGDVSELPEAFVREVVAGVSTAQHALERHNRKHTAPWFRIGVAAREDASV